jgi:hypothetical protein
MFLPAYVFNWRPRVRLARKSGLICLAVIALKSADLASALPPPVQPVPDADLLALARTKFGTLSRAEEELFRAAQEGRDASALDGDETQNDPANAANWPPDRAARAACVAWLCTDPHASALVTYHGLRLYGMRIEGPLDLSDADIKFQVMAWKCAFSRDISLQDAQTRGLYFLACQIKALDAGRATIKGSFLLRETKAEAEVNLMGAEISGEMACEGAHLHSATGYALQASAVKIGGAVFLRRGFEADGGVNLLGATIGGDLSCIGGQFSEPHPSASPADVAPDPALNAESAKIGGNVFLKRGFRAKGTVSFIATSMRNLEILEVKDPAETTIDLRLAQAGHFFHDRESWPQKGQLLLDEFRYRRLSPALNRREWLDLQPQDEFQPQPYEQLAAVLRDMGDDREAREVMIWKNEQRAKFTHFPDKDWWWYNLFGPLIGYGYRPSLAFWMSVITIFVGRFLFRRGFNHDLIAPASDNAYAKAPDGQMIEENGRPKLSERYPVFNAFVYSLESFVPLLKLDQSANWRPNANRRSQVTIGRRTMPFTGGFLRAYLYIHIALGWLLTSLWVGAITGLVKT